MSDCPPVFRVGDKVARDVTTINQGKVRLGDMAPLFHSQEVAGICLSNWKRTRLLQVACPLRILRAKARQTCGGRSTLSGWMCVVIAHPPAITGSNSGKMLDRIPDPEVNSDDMAADCLAGHRCPQVRFAIRSWPHGGAARPLSNAIFCQADRPHGRRKHGLAGPRLVGDFWQQDTSSH